MACGSCPKPWCAALQPAPGLRLLNLDACSISIGSPAAMAVLDSARRAMAVSGMALPLPGLEGWQAHVHAPAPILPRETMPA
jgi:hypothetical protein